MEKDNKERMSICIHGLTLLVGRQEQQTIACTVQKNITSRKYKARD